MKSFPVLLAALTITSSAAQNLVVGPSMGFMRPWTAAELDQTTGIASLDPAFIQFSSSRVLGVRAHFMSPLQAFGDPFYMTLSVHAVTSSIRFLNTESRTLGRRLGTIGSEWNHLYTSIAVLYPIYNARPAEPDAGYLTLRLGAELSSMVFLNDRQLSEQLEFENRGNPYRYAQFENTSRFAGLNGALVLQATVPRAFDFKTARIEVGCDFTLAFRNSVTYVFALDHVRDVPQQKVELIPGSVRLYLLIGIIHRDDR